MSIIQIILFFTCLIMSFTATSDERPVKNTVNGGEQGETIPILGDISWPHSHANTDHKVFYNREQMLEAWSEAGGIKETPPQKVARGGESNLPDIRQVDFDREMVIAVFRGKSTDHDGIKIERIIKREGKVIVQYRQIPLYKGTAPIPDYPCGVVVVPKTEGEIEFVALPPLPRLRLPIP